MIRKILLVLQLEMIIRSLKIRFYQSVISESRPSKTYGVLIAGLVVLFLFYGGVAHADAIYYWTKTLGGTNEDYGQSVAVDAIGNIYVTGYFSGTSDFDPGVGTDSHTSAGLSDIFITKINADGSYGWTKTLGGTNEDYGQSVAVDTSVNVFVTGRFSDTGDFDPGVSTDSHTSAGLSDIFLTKFRIVGFDVRPISISPAESGGTATFTVRLSSEPSANVTISVSSSDTTKGTVDKSSLIFTNLNWYANQTVTVTSVAGGTQSYTIVLGPAISTDIDYNGFDPTDVTVNSLGSISDGGGCFIATAAYGSPMMSHTRLLCKFRDRFLLSNELGKRFVHIYYTHSPPIADLIKNHDILKALVRLSLLPVLGVAWIALKIGFLPPLSFLLLLGSCFTGLLWFLKNKWQ